MSTRFARLVTLVLSLGIVFVAARADARTYYYYSDPPWIRPPLIRGTFGVSGFGTIVADQRGNDYLNHGGGFAIWGGLEFGRVLGFEAKYEASFHDPITNCNRADWCSSSFLLLETFSLDLKLHIPTRSRVVPYFVVGPMAGWIGRTGYLTDAVGGGFEAGGGVDFWISRHGTVGFEALYRGLAMSNYQSQSSNAGNTYLSLVQIGATIAAHF